MQNKLKQGSCTAAWAHMHCIVLKCILGAAGIHLLSGWWQASARSDGAALVPATGRSVHCVFPARCDSPGAGQQWDALHDICTWHRCLQVGLRITHALKLWGLHKMHKAGQAAVAAQLLHATVLHVLMPNTWNGSCKAHNLQLASKT